MSLSFTDPGQFATASRGDYDAASLAYAENMLQRTGSYQGVSQATRIPIPVLRALCKPPKPRPAIRIEPIQPTPAPLTSRTTAGEIRKAVASHYGLTVDDLLGKRQSFAVAHPRQVSMWLCKHLTLLSLPEIGRRHGDRDHTTVMHAIKAVDARRTEDDQLNEDIEAIKHQLLSDTTAIDIAIATHERALEDLRALRADRLRQMAA